jgi:hypothetical protein
MDPEITFLESLATQSTQMSTEITEHESKKLLSSELLRVLRVAKHFDLPAGRDGIGLLFVAIIPLGFRYYESILVATIRSSFIFYH